MRNWIAALAAGALLSGCETPPPGIGDGDGLAARLSGQTIELRPVGPVPPDEPEAFIFTFGADGSLSGRPVGVQQATVRDGPVAITIPLAFEGVWDVRGSELCIGHPGNLDCQPAVLAGDVLTVTDRETGTTVRARLPPA